MTELIDSFQPKYPKGWGKAITLLVLTSIGTLGKLAVTAVMWYIVIVEDSINHLNSRQKFLFLTVTLVALCGVLNVLASINLFKRKKGAIWMYLISQFITVFMITSCTMVLYSRLRQDQQIFLLVVYIVTISYSVLYLSNRKYYRSRAVKAEDTGL